MEENKNFPAEEGELQKKLPQEKPGEGSAISASDQKEMSEATTFERTMDNSQQQTENNANDSEPLIINEQLSTDNMEVHHHGHVHEKKKWKEYLFQFLMLFLAITLGFFVENQREHYIEGQREKQYAGLLLSDLRTDSMYFINRTELLESRLKKHKVFFDLMTDSVTASNKQVINAFLPLFYFYDIRITPGTYYQMKTSGSLRYIENEHLINVLEQYYVAMLVRTNIAMDVGHQFYTNVIYPFFLNHIRIQDIDDEADSVKVANPVFINRTKETDQQLLNILGNYGSDQSNSQTRYIEPLIEKNKELINFIKEEYHLK